MFLFLAIFFLCSSVNAYQGLTIVIDSGVEQPIAEAFGAVSVVTHDTIIEKQYQDMAQVLQSTPGVTIQNSGGTLSQMSVFLRGTNSNQTLVLIDGMRMANATSGTSAIQFIDPELIERVEVIRGVKTALYGADAIGGVINIITLSRSRNNQLNTSIGFGSNETGKASIGVQGRPFADNYSQIDVSYAQSQGYDVTESHDFAAGDKDGYDNTAVHLQSIQSINDIVSFKVNYLRNQGQNAYDNIWGYFNPEENRVDATKPYQLFRLEAAQTALEFEWSKFKSQFRLGLLNDLGDNKDHLHKVETSFKTKRTSAYSQNDWYTENVISTVAFDYYEDKVEGIQYLNQSLTPVNNRTNWAWILQQQFTLGLHDLKYALRKDYNESYKNQLTGQVAWQYFLQPQTKAALSVGTGFKAPSFNDLYYPEFGNPFLKPEHSYQAELNMQHQTALWQFQTSIFYNKLNEMINLTPVSPSKSLPENIGKAVIKGIEFSFKGEWKKIEYQFNYSWLSPQDETNHRQLPARTKHQFNFDVSHQWSYWRLGFAGNSQDSSFSYDNEDHTYKMAGFSVFDLYTAYQLNDRFTLQFKINNLLDKSYVTNQYAKNAGDYAPYLNAGRIFFAQVRYRLGW